MTSGRMTIMGTRHVISAGHYLAPQDAIEAPRFSTYSYPGSFEPHAYFPERL